MFENSSDFSAFLTKPDRISTNFNSLLCKVFALKSFKLSAFQRIFYLIFRKFLGPGNDMFMKMEFFHLFISSIYLFRGSLVGLII